MVMVMAIMMTLTEEGGCEARKGSTHEAHSSDRCDLTGSNYLCVHACATCVLSA
jgi:hypothetical protein